MNTRVTTLLWMALLLLVFAAPAWAEGPGKAEVDAYLDSITRTHGQLHAAGQKFGRLLGPAMQGEAREQLELYRAYREMSQLIWSVQQRTKEFSVPDHAAARLVQQANDRFLDYQLEACLSQIPAVLEVVDDTSLDATAKMERVLSLVKHDNAREVELGKQVKQAMDHLRNTTE